VVDLLPVLDAPPRFDDPPVLEVLEAPPKFDDPPKLSVPVVPPFPPMGDDCEPEWVPPVPLVSLPPVFDVLTVIPPLPTEVFSD
jgi:hypothetical protein